MRISRALAMQMALAFVCFNALLPCSAQQTATATGQAASPWMDKTLSPDQRADLLLKEMTLDEKISMVHGAGWEHNIWANQNGTPAAMEMTSGAAGYLPGVKRLGIPAIQMADAAVGVTKGAATGRFS